MSISIGRLFGVLYSSAVLLPWVSFGTNQMDSQLWSLLLGVVFIILSVKEPISLRVYSVLMIFPVVVLVGLIWEDAVTFYFMRALAVYASFAVNFIAVYILLQRYGPPVKTVIAFNLVYLAVGILQIVFTPEIVGAVVNVRTTADRGVTSLAAEPTYFGLFLFFVSWWYLVVSNYSPKVWVRVLLIINFVAMVFLARSSMAVVFVMVASAVWLLYKLKFRYVVVVCFFAGFAGFFVFFALEDTRIYSLLTRVFELGIVGVVSADASINSRVADVVLPLHGFVNNVFLPGGFTSYHEVSRELRDYYQGFFWWAGGGNIIKSFIGSLVFELGLFGVMYICMVGGVGF